MGLGIFPSQRNSFIHTTHHLGFGLDPQTQLQNPQRRGIQRVPRVDAGLEFDGGRGGHRRPECPGALGSGDQPHHWRNRGGHHVVAMGRNDVQQRGPAEGQQPSSGLPRPPHPPQPRLTSSAPPSLHKKLLGCGIFLLLESAVVRYHTHRGR